MSQPGSNVAPSKEVETVDATTLARLAADAIADKKGQDIVLLEVGDLFVITEVFVIATGTSRPHVQSLVDRVEELLKEDAGRKPLRDEGRTEAEWVLLDYGDIMVHVFQRTSRDYYDLERLWRDAPVIDWSPAVSDAP
jgi:ribosome-associated protein